MEHKAEREIFLDTLMEPAFLVREGTIVQVNKAAADLLIRPGEPVAPLLHTGATEYAGFRQGNMYFYICFPQCTLLSLLIIVLRKRFYSNSLRINSVSSLLIFSSTAQKMVASIMASAFRSSPILSQK